MTKKPEKKRELDYQSLDQMVEDVQALANSGYDQHGNWNLAQACSHVSDWMRFPMDGFPKAGFPIGFMLWAMKVTLGAGMKKKILAEGFKSGSPTDPKTIPAADAVDQAKEIKKLEEVASRLQSHNGPLHDSPLFGPMDKETLIKFHLKHASHHFGFLTPKNS